MACLGLIAWVGVMIVSRKAPASRGGGGGNGGWGGDGGSLRC